MSEPTADERARRLCELFDAEPDVIVFVDPNGVVQYANAAARRLVGSLEDDRLDLQAIFDPASMESFDRIAFPTIVGAGAWSGEMTLAGPAGPVPVAVRCRAYRDADGALAEISVVARDISDRRRSEHALRAQAHRDLLTGLSNRSEFLEHLRRALAVSRIVGDPIAVLFCDLDGFKAVNDSLGHEAGDELLAVVAARLVAGVRASDLVARVGGDEFVVLLDGVTDIAAAQSAADRLIDVVSAPIELAAGVVHVGVSIGIALGDGGCRDAEQLVSRADDAMFDAKRQGRRRAQCFDARLAARAQRRRALRADLPSALANGDFAVVYTPVVAVEDGSLQAFEAGLRWNHADFGELGPDDFMELARDLGLAHVLSALVVDDAVVRANQWVEQARSPEAHRTIWLTVGAQDLVSGSVLPLVTDAVEAGRIGPGAIGVEAPHAAICRHPNEAQRMLQALHWHGVRVSIDDVGSEPFTPAQLQRYCADSIKFDRRMIAALADAPEAVGALAALVSMARALGLDTVAKGVSTAAQVRLLQEFGCTALQGDVVSAPLSSQAIGTIHDAGTTWTALPVWPTTVQLRSAMTRSQVAERMLGLRADSRRNVA
mgnify:CR=1 FL=1